MTSRQTARLFPALLVIATCLATPVRSADPASHGFGDAAGALQAVFRSVDSERDRPEAVKKILDAHDARVVGLTGPAGAAQAVGNAFGVIARRCQGKTASSYRIGHTAFLYLLDPQGRVVMFYPEHVAARQVAADFRQRRSPAVSRASARPTGS